jgi:hypothetical protein
MCAVPQLQCPYLPALRRQAVHPIRAQAAQDGSAGEEVAMSIDDIEAKLRLAKEYREVELAVELCRRGAFHGARISAILAEDDAEAERSVRLAFTPQESAAVFRAAGAALAQRLDKLKADHGF